MKKLSVLTNCQGPAAINRYLKAGSASFQKLYSVHFNRQIQKVHAEDIPGILRSLEESDIILAQPFVSPKFAELQIDALKLYARTKGKELIVFPALHFTAMMPTIRPARYKKPGFPFGATEDVVLACLYLAGVSAQDAVKLYHEIPIFEQAELESNVVQGIDEFRHRENTHGITIRMSDFYDKNWKNHRLHHEKSHPTSVVYKHLAGALAQELEITDLEFKKMDGLRHKSGYSLPIMRSVKTALKLDFLDDEFKGRIRNSDQAFYKIIEEIFAYYRGLNVEFLTRSIKNRNQDIYERVASQLSDV